MNKEDPDLLDIFAALAMQGILSNPETPRNTPHYVAEDAYNVAEAMMRVRQERSND